jgi:hypothetical protein
MAPGAIAWSRRSREARTGFIVFPVPKCEGPDGTGRHCMEQPPAGGSQWVRLAGLEV